MEQSTEKPIGPSGEDYWKNYNSDQLKELLTEYKDKLRELTRLADLGQLSAGILHEIRNPVNFVNNFARISQEMVAELEELGKIPLSERAEEDEADQQYLLNSLSNNLVKINENGQRVERIIQGMLGQLRDEKAELVETNLPRILEEYSKLAYQSARAEDKSFNVNLEYHFSPDLTNLRLAPGEFGRVVLNLVNNACYAIFERLKRKENNYHPVIRISTRILEDQQAEIRFHDNGIGIPAETLPNLFKAFFTTKPIGKGTGLGLSLTHSSIVDLHGGTVSVESVPMEYTEFVVTLPIK
jgi:two-component system NtrC family sensor kinase